MKKISQREARQWKKLALQLQAERDGQRRAYAKDYPGGTSLGYLNRERDWLAGRIEAARRLGHPVVVTCDNSGRLDFYAVQ